MATSTSKRTRSQASGASNPPKKRRRRRAAATYPMTKRRKTKKTKRPFVPAPLPPSAKGLQHAVFDTTELLENILVQLPVKDIYKVREVNKYWKEVVHASPSILCKLFVNIQEPKRIWTKSFSDEEEGEVTVAKPGTKLSKPERFGFADMLFLDKSRLRVIGGDHLNNFPDGKLNLRPVRLNPFLKLLIPRNVKNGRRKDHASHRRVTNGRVEEVSISLRPADVQRINEWIGMEDLFMSAQLTDPPTQVVTVSQRVKCTAHHRGSSIKCFANGRVDWELECEPKVTRRGGGINMKDVIFRMLNLRRGVGRLDLNGPTNLTSPEAVYMEDVLKQARLEGHEMGGEVEYVIRLHSVVVPSEEEWAVMEKAEAEEGTEE